MGPDEGRSNVALKAICPIAVSASTRPWLSRPDNCASILAPILSFRSAGGGSETKTVGVGAGELVGGIFYFNYPGGTGLTSGAVFGRTAGSAAGAAATT